MALTTATAAVLLVAATLAAAQTGNNSTGGSPVLPGTMNYTTTPTTATPGTITTPTNFLRFNLTSVDPLAVCNDGSPGFYYFRQGTGTTATKWVIRLEGGGWCSDQQTCTLRFSASPNLMTSNTIYYPNILAGASVAGILAGDPRANPFWYTWNHVSIGYCSSDSYLGEAGTGDTAEVGAFQFRGQRIVNATIRSLLASQDLDTATDILVVGVSAGAVGAFNLADTIYSLIKPTSKVLTAFKALIDAGWFMDLPSYSIAPSAFTFRNQAIGLVENFKATFNTDCMTANSNQTWVCFFAQYAWPYVKTPLIFHEYLYDSANLGYDSAASQNNEQGFRADLTTVINTPADAIIPVSNSTGTSPPTPSVATQSIDSVGPSVQSSGPESPLPTLPASPKPPAGAPNGLYAPGLQNLPPSLLPSSLPPSKPSPPGAPPGPSQVTNAAGLPGPRGPIGTDALPPVFAPACGLHDITDNDLFAVSHIGATAFTTVLNQWLTTGQAALPLIDGTAGLGSDQYCLTALPGSG